MQYEKLTPACMDYIKSANKSNIIYSLSLQYIRNKNLSITEEKLFHLLQAGNIFTVDQLQPEEIKEISCFTIISDYKCSFICHLCPLSTHYKNQKEETESMFLSYALKSWKNYQFLVRNGLNSRLLQSLFLVNPMPTGSIVATLPLMRLAFAYLENVVKQDTLFSSLPRVITTALEQNNQGKLTEKNAEKIKTHLTYLQKNYLNIQEDALLSLLADLFNKKAQTAPDSSNPAQCQEGPAAGKVNSSKKQNIPTQETMIPSSVPCLEGLLNTPHPKTTLMHFSSAKQPKNNSEDKSPSPTISDSLFLPPTFTLTDYEATGYPFIKISGSSSSDMRQFEAFLLYNPILAVEMTNEQDSGQEYLLFYASKLFYYAATDDEKIIHLLSIYFSKSTARYQICLDPYRLYHFLQKNNLCYKSVFSLRTAHKILAVAQNRTYIKTPFELIKELCSKENICGLPVYTFSMIYYADMFSVIRANKTFQEEEQQKTFRLSSTIDTLLGVSYHLKETVETDLSLFTLDNKLDLHFEYRDNLKMKTGYYSVNFTLSSDKPINSLIINILYRFAMKNLSSKFGYRLLSFTNTSLTIATTEKYYAHLCEAIANLATYLAEKENLLPIIIKEDILNDAIRK